MKTIYIDFSEIGDEEDFFAQLREKLSLPEHFGNNLDALYDTITGDLEMPLRIEFVNMNELVKHIVNRFDMVLQSDQYREKNYRILTDITQRNLWVEIDQDKMTQVLDNIINNAIKYSPDGGRIIVRLMETHTDLIVSVSDEGLGVPRKDIPHLFDRFYRVDKARSRAMGGSGLGLAISKEVVRLHGGEIWVNSIENKVGLNSVQM